MCYVCYVKFVCVKLLSVKFVYVKFVCSVCGGGREEEEEEKEEPGIQNQKQEPHTKMWGIITTSLFSRSLESWLRFGKSSQVAQHFRLVKYYNLPSTSFPWSITIFVALIGFTPGKTGPSLPLG